MHWLRLVAGWGKIAVIKSWPVVKPILSAALQQKLEKKLLDKGRR